MRKNRVSWHQGGGNRAGCWRFSKTIGGRRRTFYAPVEIGPDERDEADRWMRSMLEGLARKAVDVERIKVSEIAAKWQESIRERVARGVAKPNTYLSRRRESNIVCRAIGPKVASSLTMSDADAMVSSWKGMSPTTIRNRIITLKAMLNWAVDRGMIPSNPLAKLGLPAVPYNSGRYMPLGEIEGFLAWLDRRAERMDGWLARFARIDALMVRLIAETGCRPGEAAALRWSHWLPERQAFVMDEHKTAGSTGRPRIIMPSRELAAKLEAFRDGPDANPGWVFVRPVLRNQHSRYLTPPEKRHGHPFRIDGLCRLIKNLRREAIAEGVAVGDSGADRFHLYRLRHSRITQQIQEGRNIADVAALSGNSIRQIEKTYLHPQLDHLRKVVDGA